MAYSAVSQPSPLPRFQPGTPSSTEAVHSTRVAPKVMRHEPSAYGATPRSNEIGRRDDAARPTRFALTDFTEFPNDCGSRVTGSERHDNDASTPTFDFCCADYSVFRIIAAFHDDIRLEMPDQIERGVLRENYYEVDAFQRGKHVCSLRVGAYGTRRSLEATHGVVAVDADYQSIRGGPRREKHIDVSRVQQVEHAVGESNSTFLARPPTLRRHPGCYLRRRIARLQSLLAAEGWKWRTCSFFMGSLMTSS